ncbi:ATP-binding region ATPase domain protein [Desulfovibrio sp. X2]|uniref:ATP-binding protein n=1 Tax=Desulfovibrio sp. X2 TaxID=941449 RepID=UPI000358D6AA|nr:HAMP domain-containing sensor histidine kinase [Desulfovibrio sp. X2]EPR44533.1 ATP-binding region ATPase domain protein [Desulfovibrio sp. X2]
MEQKSGGFRRWTVIAIAVVLVTALHFGNVGGEIGLHMVHRELYFVPILLSAFWFGFRSGLAVALLVSALYLLGLVVVGFHHVAPLVAVLQTAVFILAAGLLGWLAERQRVEQAEEAEADKLQALGQAASALSFDLQNFVRTMERLYAKAGGFGVQDLDAEFAQQMARARILMATVESFVPKRHIAPVAEDLNLAVSRYLDEEWTSVAGRRVRLVRDLDPTGCPAFVDQGQVVWVLDKLLQNALDVTRPGGEVRVFTRCEEKACLLGVEDHGPGIPADQQEKLFTPFFTTKGAGTGLALAGSMRTMREMGGDIVVRSEPGKGSLFTLVVPGGVPQGCKEGGEA